MEAFKDLWIYILGGLVCFWIVVYILLIILLGILRAFGLVIQFSDIELMMVAAIITTIVSVFCWTKRNDPKVVKSTEDYFKRRSGHYKDGIDNDGGDGGE
jgi:hypothetical protein